jgi:alkaline phosphatase D
MATFPFVRRRRLLSRRGFLRAAGGSAIAIAAPALIGCATTPAPRWRDDPFSLGVASGEPGPDGFVLWTRLAPDPLSPDPDMAGDMVGGRWGGDVVLDYEIASDPGMGAVVQRGTAVAEGAYAHSVHLEVRGLEPGRPYWYRFASGLARSPIGRAMTAPAPNAPLSRLKFAFVSCANYEHGYFAAYRHLADENPDLVLFLGDYIYEFVERRRRTVRTHSGGADATTLSGYRARYAQYRLDDDLRRLHATAPCLMTWDDHEVQNDYAGQWSETFEDPTSFLQRRADAYRAFYEHMPVRPSRARPNGPWMRLHERFAFGDLVSFAMLDGRQHRAREACYGPPDRGRAHLVVDATCPERRDPARSMLGPEQEAWLYQSLARSTTRWNILGQDVLMAAFRKAQDDGTVGFSSDDWNGYPEARTRLLGHVRDSRVANPVVLSGDIHSFWANDLKADFDDPRSATIATELVGTSVSSVGPSYTRFRKWTEDNPHVRFFESRKRGYVSVDLTPERLTARFRALSDARKVNATASTLRTFVVESGRPGINVA